MRSANRPATAVFAIFLLLAGGGAATAETDPNLNVGDQRTSLAGSYLAGRSADRARDIGTAALYYGRALAADPANAGLMDRVLLLGLASGDMDRSFAMAERLLELDASNPAALMALATQAISGKRPDDAIEYLGGIARADLAWITKSLMTAWIEFGRGKLEAGLEVIADLSGPDWYTIFKDYHTAIILDAAGRKQDAVEAINRAYSSDTTALRVVDAYARIMANAGEHEKAIEALVAFGGETPFHPIVRELLDEIRSGNAPPPLAATTEAGVAEVLYGLGSAIGLEDGAELSAAYLRLAAYLAPNDHLITMAVGDAYQGVERCDDAIEVYESVPETSTLRRNADIQIGACLQTLERYGDATEYLTRVVDANQDDVEAAVQLGNAYRADSRFAEAADIYTQALALNGDPEDADWRIFYFRGVSLERSKRWDEAESDFRMALALNPDQPQVLNYLGYSWVDRGVNLDEGLEMIRKAVDERPNDGYIVDSLGWAYYRLGRFDEAVTALETAVQLRAEDPVINDHLGDAYWKVGRKREALFQWAHARDLEPDEEALPVILDKLQNGLDGAMLGDSVTVEAGESLWDIAIRVYGDAGQYELILEANKDKISDPNLIYPGMTLSVPAPAIN